MTIAEIIDKGGLVVLFLLGYSLVAMTLVLERLMVLATLARPPRGLDEQLPAAIRGGVEQVKAMLEALRGPEAALMQAVLKAHLDGVRDLQAVAVRTGSEQLQKMERGFRTLAVLGNTAPLLGLFGTIIGMIKAFMVIEQAGGKVDASALAGGIWEAMVTTGVGLAVAIPILLLLHLLEGMADRRAKKMRYCASLLIERLPHSFAHDEGDAVIRHPEGSAHAV